MYEYVHSIIVGINTQWINVICQLKVAISYYPHQRLELWALFKYVRVLIPKAYELVYDALLCPLFCSVRT